MSVKEFILDNIERHPKDIVNFTAEHFSITRTTVHRHLKKLQTENLIIKSGVTRDTIYSLASSVNRHFKYQINDKLSESTVFSNDFESIVNTFSHNVVDIIHYGFTEMFNNAIDHAFATHIETSISMKQGLIEIIIQDNGIGIFQKLTDFFQLDDLRECILHLSKGKMTTDPANHTGEGIFFSSRMFGQYEIYANGLHYIRDNIENDWTLKSTTKIHKGTRVLLTIHKNAKTNIVDVFKKYQRPDDYGFDRTEFLVELSRFAEERFISRSQAKRILRGLDKFNRVTLDFKNVRMVGQGFVDEIFRVFLHQHPTIEINYSNANSDVSYMLERGIAIANKSKRMDDIS